MSESQTSFWSRRALIGLAVGLPTVEAMVLLILGVDSGISLAAQVSGLGPFGVFHDLRWLIVSHSSVVAFVVGLVVLLALRSVLGALLVRFSWPDGRPVPSIKRLLRDGAIATSAAVVALSPWVALLFGAAVIPLSWVFFGALPPALLTMLLLHHAGATADWWRRLPALRSIGWAAIAFGGLTLSGLAVAGRSGPAVIPIVAVAGLFNAWVWQQSVRTVVLRPVPARRRSIPATVVALVLLVALVIGGSGIGFAVFEGEHAAAAAPSQSIPAGQGVLVVPGFASACCDDVAEFRRAAAGVLMVEQFSYAGLDDRGRPIPHDGEATDGDLAVLAELLHRQVETLASRTEAPVALIAESEGTLVATTYLETYRDVPVDRVALLSPIVAPGRAEYPAPGVDGQGVVGGYQLRAMVALVDSLSSLSLSADGPLSRSVRDGADLLAEATGRDRPQIEELAVLPLADAVTSGPDPGYDIAVVVVAGFHGGLRGRPEIQRMLMDWLQGRPIEGSAVLASLERIIAGSAAPWQVPALGE